MFQVCSTGFLYASHLFIPLLPPKVKPRNLILTRRYFIRERVSFVNFFMNIVRAHNVRKSYCSIIIIKDTYYNLPVKVSNFFEVFLYRILLVFQRSNDTHNVNMQFLLVSEKNHFQKIELWSTIMCIAIWFSCSMLPTVKCCLPKTVICYVFCLIINYN